MIKQIGTLNIEIERRKIKNINIYVKPPNGDVLVTVPMRVSDEEVFRFLKKKEDWILKNHEKVKNRQNSSNHKISGYGLVLKDDIIHAPKHTLHIPLIFSQLQIHPNLFTVNTTASPSCFHISNRKTIRMNFHDRFPSHCIFYDLVFQPFPLFQINFLL